MACELIAWYLCGVACAPFVVIAYMWAREQPWGKRLP